MGGGGSPGNGQEENTSDTGNKIEDTYKSVCEECSESVSEFQRWQLQYTSFQ